jgi:hypothetical protein
MKSIQVAMALILGIRNGFPHKIDVNVQPNLLESEERAEMLWSD